MTHLATYKNVQQLKNFQAAQKILSPKYIHPGNIWRVGLELYENVLTFKATIVQIKDLEKGEKVGYDFIFTAPRKMKIGVVSAGYHDGVDRKLSNISPFVGRVSMNICAVDMSKFLGKKEGDQIILPIKNEILFPYETFIHLNPVTKRVVV
jgi:alanine racemase